MEVAFTQGKKFLHEFKEFATKGNVVDLAVGVIIGGAFGKIVSSLVTDIVMPPLGVLIGGVNFKELAVVLKPEVVDGSGTVTATAVTINYGVFIQNTIDFVIIAAAIFVAVKFSSRFKQKEEAKAVPPPKPTQEVLLEEIRDLLKEREK